MLLLTSSGDECALLFTRRSDSVQDHKGQVAFPGGGMEPQDANLEETALREAEEEIGLVRSAVRVIGRLQPFPTISKFVIFPVVALFYGQERFVLSAKEVERVFTIPLVWLARRENWTESPYIMRGDRLEQVIHYKDYEGEHLWGITARIVHHFLEVIQA